MTEHPLFVKYTRAYISKCTGYSLGYLSRVSKARTPLTKYFMERVSYALCEHPVKLFLAESLPNEHRRERRERKKDTTTTEEERGEELEETQQKTKGGD